MAHVQMFAEQYIQQLIADVVSCKLAGRATRILLWLPSCSARHEANEALLHTLPAGHRRIHMKLPLGGTGLCCLDDAAQHMVRHEVP
jgi:hypothetical protein